jgi:isopenicillin N synthase-like dioxygenase
MGRGSVNELPSVLLIPEQNKRFFALPENTKRQIAHPPQANPNRGWSAIGQEKSSAITDFEKGKAAAEEVFDVKVSVESWRNR